jgi:hypothetical protein
MPAAVMAPPQTPAAAGDPLFDELWHACAGPLVTVPRVGDLVFYFPQGHIEQVAAAGLSPSLNSSRPSAIRLREAASLRFAR